MKRLSSALLVLALLNGCTTVGTASSDAPATATAIRVETTGRIDQFIADEMKKRHIAGLSAAVVSDGQIRYAKGYGLADIDRRAPVLADTPFLVASITKMFTAVGTMLLVQDGKVQLDAPVGTYVDDLPMAWRPVTVQQLLGHTGGINSFTNYDTPPCKGPFKAEENYVQQDVIAEVSCLPLDFEPGTSFTYSDAGYFVLGMMIERVSGLTYEAYLRQRIFQPLAPGYAFHPTDGTDGRG